MNSERRAKLIFYIAVWAVIVAIAAFLCVFVVNTRKEEARVRDLAKRLELEVYPLNAERSSLALEKDNIDRNLIDSLGCSAAVGVTLLDLDEVFFETFFNAFNLRNLPGTLCLSKNELPGMEGKITLERYHEVISLGWDTALLFESRSVDPDILAEELYTWLNDMSLLLSELEIEMPRVVLFNDKYYLSLDSVLLEFGITVAAHRSEAGLPFVEQSSGDSGVWHPGMVGWNDSGNASNMLHGVTNTGGYFMYTIGIGEERLQYDRFIPTRREHVASVDAMARRLAEGVSLDAIRLLTSEDARRFRSEYLQSYEYYRPFAEEKKRQIDIKIAEIEARIEEIYKKYGY